MLVLAVLLAPPLMHARSGQAAGHQYHAEAVAHGHLTATHDGEAGDHATHMRGAEYPRPSDGTEPGSVCFHCVLCVGAVGIVPAAMTPTFQQIAVHPVPAPMLAALEPEPGIRPPLV